MKTLTRLILLTIFFSSLTAIAGTSVPGFPINNQQNLIPKALPVHTFNRIFESGFDCTQIISSDMDIVSFLNSLPVEKNIVCLQPGTYILTQTLMIPSNTTLQGFQQGENRDATVLFLAAGVNDNVISITNKQNITIKHLKIDGNGLNQQGKPDPSGVWIYQSSNVNIIDIEVANTARMGIAMAQNSYVSIEDSYIHDVDKKIRG